MSDNIIKSDGCIIDVENKLILLNGFLLDTSDIRWIANECQVMYTAEAIHDNLYKLEELKDVELTWVQAHRIAETAVDEIPPTTGEDEAYGIEQALKYLDEILDEDEENE